MRLLHYLVNIAIVIFLAATSEAFSTVSTARVSAHTRRATVVSTSRSLRTRNAAGSDDEERTIGGISVPFSEKLAALVRYSQVTDEQLKMLDTWIFHNPQFAKWVQYADDLSATAAISTLTAQYGDDQLYRILKAAETDSSSKELASRLLIDQLKHWVRIGKDPDEVFELYKLQYAGGRILETPQFSAWTKYVDDVNAKHEGAISIVPTLRKFYSDGELLRIAEGAKRIDELASVGLKLENALVQFWIDDKRTPAKVLAGLRQWVTAKTLEDPLFGVLVKYTDAYNVQFPKTKTTMFETFTNAFGDEKVATMLTAAKTKEAKKIATEWEAAQLQMWFSSGKSVDDVYVLLKLPDKYSLYDLQKNPLFPIWIAYINKVSIENPDKVSRLLSTMTTQFKDKPMMQILQAAEKFPSMESVAVTLQLEKAEKLFATGVSPYDAFQMVALDTVGDSVLGSPLFTKWMSYVEDFNKMNPAKEESWFLPLRTNYNFVDRLIETARKKPKTAKIADTVEKAQMDEWLTTQRHPDHVFSFLNLDNAGEKVFSSLNFELWVKYLNDFNKEYPNKKTTMIDSIRENYIDLRLMPILDEAEKIPSTKKLAKDLQNALLDKWVDEKKTVAYLKGWIGHEESYNVWAKRYTEKLNKLS